MAIYNSSFGFSEAPFENKLDQRFLFLGRDHGEVLAALLYFMQENKGLAMVCGDVGTGKTMLLHGFLGKLPDSVQPILISNPLVSYRVVMGYIASSLGIPWRGKTLLELLDEIKETLSAARSQGKTFILIIDEAHLLSDASLEQIRLLSNLETAEGKLLQILLVGQYELSHRLNLPKFRQLRQRINVNRFLSPLPATETWQYIEFRLIKAGSQPERCFSPKCKKLIWKLTGGLPRRINQLCDTALVICMTEGRKQVDPRILKKARDALRTDQIFTARLTSLPRTMSLLKQKRFLVPSLACLLLLILWGLMGSASVQGGLGQIFHKGWLVVKGLSPVRTSSTEPGGEGRLAATSSPSEGSVGLVTGATQVPAPVDPPKSKGDVTPPVSPKSPAEAEKPADLPEDVTGTRTKTPPPTGQEAAVQTDPGLRAAVEASTASEPSRPSQVEAENNDTLIMIARRWFPEQEKLGLLALVLANPQALKEDQIFAGQKLNLPGVNPADQTIRLQDGRVYALYGEYPSLRDLQKAIAHLGQHKVRYAIMNDLAEEDRASYQVLIGAYGNQQDLDQALSRVKKNLSRVR